MKILKVNAIILLLLATLFASNVHAQNQEFDSSSFEINEFWFHVAFLLPTTAILIGNSSYIMKDFQAPLGWRVGGWISGITSIGFGVRLLFLSSEEKKCENCAQAGIIHSAFGLMTIGAAIWSSRLPTLEEKKRLTLTPIAIQDSGGNLAMGMGVCYVGW